MPEHPRASVCKPILSLLVKVVNLCERRELMPVTWYRHCRAISHYETSSESWLPGWAAQTKQTSNRFTPTPQTLLNDRR